MITKNSVVKIQNLVVNHESQPVESKPVLHYRKNLLVTSQLPKSIMFQVKILTKKGASSKELLNTLSKGVFPFKLKFYNFVFSYHCCVKIDIVKNFYILVFQYINKLKIQLSFLFMDHCHWNCGFHICYLQLLVNIETILHTVLFFHT